MNRDCRKESGKDEEEEGQPGKRKVHPRRKKDIERRGDGDGATRRKRRDGDAKNRG